MPSIVIAVLEVVVSEEVGIEHGRKDSVNGYGGRSKPIEPWPTRSLSGPFAGVAVINGNR